MEERYINGFIGNNVSVMFHLNETCGQEVIISSNGAPFCRIRPPDKPIVGKNCNRSGNGWILFSTKFDKQGEHVFQWGLEKDGTVIYHTNVTFNISSEYLS